LWSYDKFDPPQYTILKSALQQPVIPIIGDADIGQFHRGGLYALAEKASCRVSLDMVCRGAKNSTSHSGCRGRL